MKNDAAQTPENRTCGAVVLGARHLPTFSSGLQWLVTRGMRGLGMPHSIKWRLQLWYGLILVVVLAGFGGTAYQLERDKVFRHADNELQRRLNVLVQVVRRTGRPLGQRPPFRAGDYNQPPRPLEQFAPEAVPLVTPESFRLQPRDEFLFDAASPNGFYYVVSDENGKEIARSTNAPFNANVHYESSITQREKRSSAFPPLKDGRLKYNSPDFKSDNFPQDGIPAGQPFPPYFRGSFREIDILIAPNDRNHGLQILVGRNMAAELAELRLATLKLTGIGLVILVFGLAGGGWLVKRSLRPVSEISSAAAKIATGDLTQRINVAEAESELGQLAAVLNSTFARLETAFAQQKQFAADAAHELRTPVTVMLTQTQTALSREREAASYQQTVEACQRAAQRMRRLIESLLELARFDAGQEVLQRRPLDLAKIVADGVELVKPLAEEREVKILAEVASLEITGDADRLAQVITNLLTNAVQYNRPGGEVRLQLESVNGLAVLTVADTGKGLPPPICRAFSVGFFGQTRRGLGLAMWAWAWPFAKPLLRRMAGRLTFPVRPAKGAFSPCGYRLSFGQREMNSGRRLAPSRCSNATLRSAPSLGLPA